jgi:hypothetical protein
MVTRTPASSRTDDAANLRRSNVRMGLTLATIALVFFGGVIAAKYMGGYEVGLSIVGGAAFLFLVLAIGRNLWGK